MSGIAIPPNTTEMGCTSESLHLGNLTISNTTIYGGSPLQGQNTSISFHIINSATGIDSLCAAQGVALTPNGIGSDPYIWYDCTNVNANQTTKASFQYNAQINELTFNETWICYDKEPILFQASGSDTIPITCTSLPSEDQFTRRCTQDKETAIDICLDITLL
ncbi:hypothetical protein BR93DRAFT_935982 [Coniochaeta sp. PMI_546]|nr:hypothetical protein BR93DRAFT_935982 [Coniochaeta sp. PMI_546]